MANAQQQLMPIDPADQTPANTENTITALIERVCTDPAFDTNKLEHLMQLKEREDAKRAAERFHAAVSAFQGECPMIEKKRFIVTKKGARIPYAAYEDVMVVAGPILNRHGLSVDFDTETCSNTAIKVLCRVSGFGHTKVTSFTAPVPVDMYVNDTQKMAAANSYGKRYAIQNALNIVIADEDTDAANLSRSAATVSTDQAKAIADLLGQLPDDVQDSFFDWLGVERVQDIPASRHAEVVDKLRGRIAGSKGAAQ